MGYPSNIAVNQGNNLSMYAMKFEKLEKLKNCRQTRICQISFLFEYEPVTLLLKCYIGIDIFKTDRLYLQ